MHAGEKKIYIYGTLLIAFSFSGTQIEQCSYETLQNLLRRQVMKRKGLRYTTLGLLVATLSIPTVWAASSHAGHQHGKAATLARVHEKILPMSLKSIDIINRAVASGDKQAALRELNHLKAMLAQIQAAVAKKVGPAFANTKCPIMGSPINPDKVSVNLVREYKGQKVAFCCVGCPAQWDKLSNRQKLAKLDKVKAAGSHTSHDSHKHH